MKKLYYLILLLLIWSIPFPTYAEQWKICVAENYYVSYSLPEGFKQMEANLPNVEFYAMDSERSMLSGIMVMDARKNSRYNGEDLSFLTFNDASYARSAVQGFINAMARHGVRDVDCTFLDLLGQRCICISGVQLINDIEFDNISFMFAKAPYIIAYNYIVPVASFEQEMDMIYYSIQTASFDNI